MASAPPPLAPGLTAARLAQALKRFEGVVGASYVFTSEEDRYGYLDPYSPGDPTTYGPSAAVAPKSVEEVQAIIRIANELRIPLWPISRGRNFGYGGAAPSMPGAVTLDLIRMNRILEVNEDYGYCVIEPGVGFNDLYAHLKKTGSRLWMSGPAHTLGSVIGNAMERGVGYTPYGEHASKVCGMEVVLPSGELMRTGMGAMDNSSSWHLYKYGFGPDWQGAFMQSNLGVVTKMGLWMMPEPEATTNLTMALPNEDDLGPAVDVLRPLRMTGVVGGVPSIANAVRALALRYPRREDLWKGDGPIPPADLEALRVKHGVGHWNFSLRMFGRADINAINTQVVKDAFARITKAEFKEEHWKQGDPPERSGQAMPGMNALNIVHWRGGRGGHLDFSPVSAPNGAEAMKQYRMGRKLFESYGFDYYGGFTMGERYINHITMIIYDRDNAAMTDKARKLFAELVKTGAAEGYGEYRAHVLFGGLIADSYGYNHHALQRFNETVKDALDPNGVIAPGKMGIWPKGYRPEGLKKERS